MSSLLLTLARPRRRGQSLVALALAATVLSDSTALAQPSAGAGVGELRGSGSSIRRIVETSGIQLSAAGSDRSPCQIRRGDTVALAAATPVATLDANAPAVDIRVLTGACAGAAGKASPAAISGVRRPKPKPSGIQ